MTDNPDRPDRPPLDEALLARLLRPVPGPGDAGWRVEVLAETASTNAVVAARAREGAPEGLVVAAEHQTSGRGRLDRSWESPPRAGLTFSVLVRPRVPDHRWPWLPLLTGLAVLDGVQRAGGPSCRLKWPNDVEYADRKLGGLLAERVETPLGPAAVLGVGLNVSTRAAELPVPSAGSLATVGRAGIDRTGLLGSVLAAVAEHYLRWSADDGDPAAAGLLIDYRSACETLGRDVRISLPVGEPVTGRAVDVAEDGSLLVDVGARRGPVAVTAGDVIHLRSADRAGVAGSQP